MRGKLPSRIERWSRWLQSRWRLQRLLAIRGLAQHRHESQAIAGLVKALDAADARLSFRAEAALRELSGTEAVEALCELALRDPEGSAARVCIDRGFRPRDKARAALFLFLTRQFEVYFREDSGFALLRREYERADPVIRGQVMTVARSAEPRLQGFRVTPRKLSECTAGEIEAVIHTLQQAQNWSELWCAFLELPVKYGLSLLKSFSASGWEPEDERSKALFREIGAFDPVDDAMDQAEFPSKVFAAWLRAEAPAELAGWTSAERAHWLEHVPPPQGASLVAVLAREAQVDEQMVRLVASSPHWLVRLAGHLTGVTPLTLAATESPEPIHWVRVLTAGQKILDFWPAKATRGDLEALNALSPEISAGRLSVARRLLKALIQYHLDSPRAERMVVEVVADHSVGNGKQDMP